MSDAGRHRRAGPESDERTVLDEQILYYRARAPEYEDWIRRAGRYDRGEEHRRQWLAELGEVVDALGACRPGPRVLELACGTGLWTPHLLRPGNHVTALDAAPEALAIHRRRVATRALTRVQADLFRWQPTERYDFVFFGFWLSHVPAARFDAFWRLVARALRPNGRVFFVDSRFTQASTARDHARLDRSGTASRRLNDGRVFEIVKVFHEPSDLEQRLASRGWRGRVQVTEQFFLYAALTRTPSRPDPP